MPPRSRSDVRNPIPSLGSVPLLAAMGILAAALGDPIVEAIASTGTFGSGFHDADRSSVLPTILAGLALSLGAFVLRCLQEWRSPHGYRLRGSQTAAVDPAPLLQLTIVFGLALSIVAVMQTSEDLLAGRIVDVHAWLGGPAIFALSTYGAICAALAASLRLFMQPCVTMVVEDLREAQRRLRAHVLRDAFELTARSVPCGVFGALDPSLRRTRGRAPPF